MRVQVAFFFLNGLPNADVTASCQAAFIERVDPETLTCDVGELKAIDWQEETGQCRCQNSCDCLHADIKSYGHPDGWADATTHPVADPRTYARTDARTNGAYD